MPTPAYIVPYVVGLPIAQATAQILGAALDVGRVTSISSLFVPAGTIVNQTPVEGTRVLAGAPVDLVQSSGVPAPAPLIEPYDSERTILSQYANSPTLTALIANMQAYFDPRANLKAFYDFVWNVDTAEGFGLDIWGRIVGVSRLLRISGDNNVFGFWTADLPYDWQPWGQAPFSGGPIATDSYQLPDSAYRTLILTKALANISATNAPSLNRLLRNLFPGRGVCYTVDRGNMAMSFVFHFALTNIEYAILTQSNALPHPAGVFYDVVVVPDVSFFGFKQQGGQPFNQGTFYVRP